MLDPNTGIPGPEHKQFAIIDNGKGEVSLVLNEKPPVTQQSQPAKSSDDGK